MIGKIIAFIVFVILVSMLRSFLARLLSPASQGTSRSRPAETAKKTISGQMVKDPFCGMYVATDLSVTATIKGEVVHFCSEQCLNSYVRKLKHPG